MEQNPSRFLLTGKQLAALVYVGIALTAVGFATVETYGNVQWFSALDNLDIRIVNVSFHLDGHPLGYPFLAVNASVKDPTGFKNLMLLDVVYTVYVNSASENFSVQSSPEIGQKDNTIHRAVPSEGSLNLTFAFGLLPGVAVPPQSDPLQSFLNRHEQTDLVTYVELTLYFNSAYGHFSNDYCYNMLTNAFGVCPPARNVSPSGLVTGG